MQISSTADKKQIWIRGFFYGHTRSGKTTAAATFPDPFFIVPANENSVETLMSRDDILYGVVGAGKDAPDQELEAALDKMWLAAQKGTLYDDFGQTIVVEMLSHYQDLVIESLRNRISGKGANDARQLYGRLGEHLLRVRDKLWRLPAHIIFTSLAEIRSDKEGNVTEGRPMVAGRSGHLLPSSCNIIAYFEQKQTRPPTYVANVCAKGNFDGGSRIPGFDNGVYENFGYALIEPALRRLAPVQAVDAAE